MQQYRLRHITVIDVFAVFQVKVLTSVLVYSRLESTLFLAFIQSPEPYMIDPVKLWGNAARHPSDRISRCNSQRLAAIAIWIMPRQLSLLLAVLGRFICSP